MHAYQTYMAIQYGRFKTFSICDLGLLNHVIAVYVGNLFFDMYIEFLQTCLETNTSFGQCWLDFGDDPFTNS